MRTLSFAVLTALLTLSAQAAVFDAADILPQNAGALSTMGELLLSDPTSEGVEFHGRYGLTDDWNLAAIMGGGSKSKKFRFGGEGVFNLLPDWEGQFGLSFLGSAIYLNRFDGGGLQTRVGPMIHKRITGWGGLPANLYAALPWYLEVRGSAITTGTQLVVGSDFDIADGGRFYGDAEFGIKLAKTDSYLVLGIGMRLGDLSFNRAKSSNDSGSKSQSLPKNTKGSKRGNDYTDEDFKK